MRFFQLNEEHVFVGDTKNKWLRIEHGWTRPAFEEKFNMQLPIGISEAHYEPPINVYSICLGEGPPVMYEDPTVHPFLDWVHQNFENIIFEAANEMMPDCEYDSQTDSWSIPAARQAEIDLEQRQNARIHLLQSAIKDQFKMIMALFDVGKAKGIWTNTDFDPELRTKVSEWKQIIADHDNKV